MRIDTSFRKVRVSQRLDTESALADLFNRMRPDVADRYDAGAKRLIAQRWVDALADLAEERNMSTAEAIGGALADKLGFEDFNPDVMRAWLRRNAEIVADGVTSNAEDKIAAADDPEDEDNDPVGHVFGILGSSGAASLAVSMTTTAANFAVRDTAEKSGAAVKVWRVTSGNPRASHAAMNGESVAMNEKFSNGLMWPGDPEGDADEVAECQCALDIIT